jgi:glycosyltransferase involved in cell wall biosynthesis
MKTRNVVHGLWIGTKLSRLERLTMQSFVRHGHPFNLWVYDELDDAPPPGVALRDAAAILPRNRIFLKAEQDPGAGVGRRSYGPFSDLFRYKLLHDEGGIWVDMDVTCLKPFDFAEPYVFRSHRIGVMGNLIKAPRHSPLMKQTYECAEAAANENVSWLTLNRILGRFVRELGLEGYIKNQIINDEDLGETIAAYAGGAYRPPPPAWYGIHWGNEYWGTRTFNHAAGNGHLPAKDRPVPGSLLHELYRNYGLIGARAAEARPPSMLAVKAPAAAAALKTISERRRSINMLLPTLVRGGAERIVVDIATMLAADQEIEVHIYVKTRSKTAHDVKRLKNLHIVYLNEPGAPSLRGLAQAMIERGNPVIFTHLIRRHDLEVLWQAGAATVPVLHNSSQGWNESPALYDHTNVPFIIACADSVRAEAAAVCKPPVITIRHEVTLSPNAQDLQTGRRKIRSQWGIGDDVLLIGMIGQFKTQKAYTRAVRVLARVLEAVPAKLMIVGGWDHKYGAGRIAFEATMRLAVELGVVADMICAGETDNPLPYLAAFDVFLSTSIFEGLSVSVMEAIACGCPLVLAAVGGVKEIVPQDGVLVADPADTEAYAEGILRAAARRVRNLPPRPPEPELVAHIWLGLSETILRLIAPRYPAANGILFVLDGLHYGGPAVSLTRLLGAAQRRGRAALVLQHGVSVPGFAEAIGRADVPMFTLKSGASTSRAAGQILVLLADHNFSTLCFWSAAPELKLLLGKLLSATAVEIIDVSPGPMLFDELDDAAAFARRIAFSPAQYFERLDHFIALYDAGVPDPARGAPRRVSVIPLGVPPPPSFIPLPPAELLPPEQADPELAIGTITRIVPYKRLELLLEAMAIIGPDFCSATLTIVGGPDPTCTDYAAGLKDKVRQWGIKNVFFAGPYADVNRFLAMWKIFVLAGERQGCPNASLEAMAMGLPVVAFESGGLREQVIDGRTGFLVNTAEEMAERLRALLGNPVLRRRMGQQGRLRAQQVFGLEKTAAAFCAALGL